MKLSKNQKDIKFDKEKEYSFIEGLKLVRKFSKEKFNASVELSLNLNVDTTNPKEQLRGTFLFPNGTGKTPKVLVVTTEDNFEVANNAKADFVGGIEMLEKIKTKNWFEFDYIVTTPSMMKNFGKYARILGPKGLMPNPKLGTISDDIGEAVKNIKLGQLEYRTNKEGLMNIIIGKIKFTDANLIENYDEFMKKIVSIRPSSVKGNFIKTIYISSTMGPGVKLAIKN